MQARQQPVKFVYDPISTQNFKNDPGPFYIKKRWLELLVRTDSDRSTSLLEFSVHEDFSDRKTHDQGSRIICRRLVYGHEIPYGELWLLMQSLAEHHGPIAERTANFVRNAMCGDLIKKYAPIEFAEWVRNGIAFGNHGSDCYRVVVTQNKYYDTVEDMEQNFKGVSPYVAT